MKAADFSVGYQPYQRGMQRFQALQDLLRRRRGDEHEPRVEFDT
jgi:hypothetical protein